MKTLFGLWGVDASQLLGGVFAWGGGVKSSEWVSEGGREDDQGD